MMGPPSGRCPSRVAAAVVVMVSGENSTGGRLILGQDLVQLLAGLLDHGDAPLELCRLTGARKLLGRAHELSDGLAQRDDRILVLAVGLPGRSRGLGLGPSRF